MTYYRILPQIKYLNTIHLCTYLVYNLVRIFQEDVQFIPGLRKSIFVSLESTNFTYYTVKIIRRFQPWDSHGGRPVKKSEIGKRKIQVLIKVGYFLSDLKVSDLNSYVFSHDWNPYYTV